MYRRTRPCAFGALFVAALSVQLVADDSLSRFAFHGDGAVLEYAAGSAVNPDYKLTIFPDHTMTIDISGKQRGRFAVSREKFDELLFFIEENGFMDINEDTLSEELIRFRRSVEDRGTTVDGGVVRVRLRLWQYKTVEGEVISEFENSIELDNPIKSASIYPEIEPIAELGRICLELQTIVWRTGAPDYIENLDLGKQIDDLRTSLRMPRREIFAGHVERIEDQP